nr:MAG TPA: hypothetical protein [Caudoviricetes sp.]
MVFYSVLFLACCVLFRSIILNQGYYCKTIAHS